MTQYIDKSALVAEIESKFQKYWKMGEESDALQDGNAKYWGGVLSCLNEVKTLINTLEVKEVEKPTAADGCMVEEIIINLKRVEQDYHIDLTKEMEWLRNQVKKRKER